MVFMILPSVIYYNHQRNLWNWSHNCLPMSSHCGVFQHLLNCLLICLFLINGWHNKNKQPHIVNTSYKLTHNGNLSSMSTHQTQNMACIKTSNQSAKWFRSCALAVGNLQTKTINPFELHYANCKHICNIPCPWE